MPGNKLSFFDNNPSTAITGIGLTSAFGVAAGVATMGGIMILSMKMTYSAVPHYAVLATTIGMGLLALVFAVGNYILNKKAEHSQEYSLSPAIREKVTTNNIVGMIAGGLLGLGIFAFAKKGEGILAFAALGLVILAGLVIRNYCKGCDSTYGEESNNSTAAIAPNSKLPG